MDILHLIDRLEEMVTDARRLPVGGGAVIPRQRLLDLIDRMRVAVPREVYDARELVEKQEEILHKARDEAALMLAEARERLEARITDASVVKAAILALANASGPLGACIPAPLLLRPCARFVPVL